MPAVPFALIAFNNIVAEEAFNRLDRLGRGRLGSGLGLSRSWCGLGCRLRSWFSGAASASTAGSLGLPFLGIITRPGPFARGAAWCMATVLIVFVPAVITPVQHIGFF